MNDKSSNSKNLKFEKEQKVKFSHCDFAGIVFYPRFFVMLNDLVEDWFADELGFSFKAMHPNYGVPSVHIDTDFRSPATIGDVLTKSLYISDLGSRSVTYQFTFTNQKDQVVLEGKGTLVSIGKNSEGQMKPIEWREDVRSKMQRFLK